MAGWRKGRKKPKSAEADAAWKTQLLIATQQEGARVEKLLFEMLHEHSFGGV